MCLRFWCAYSLAGNESMKTIMARKKFSVLEAVYWYNVMPKDDISPSRALADVLYKYHVRVRGRVLSEALFHVSCQREQTQV